MDGLAVLERLGGGGFIDELYQAILQVGEEVVATGKPGTVSVTLKIQQAHKGSQAILVLEEINRRPPKSETQGAHFFAIAGGLHREDPRQTKLDFRVVGGTETEVRDTKQEAVIKEAAE